jgi:hypothetical protein
MKSMEGLCPYEASTDNPMPDGGIPFQDQDIETLLCQEGCGVASNGPSTNNSNVSQLSTLRIRRQCEHKIAIRDSGIAASSDLYVSIRAFVKSFDRLIPGRITQIPNRAILTIYEKRLRHYCHFLFMYFLLFIGFTFIYLLFPVPIATHHGTIIAFHYFLSHYVDGLYGG